MLRVTTERTDAMLSFQLEGKLVGPWVAVLRECWQRRPLGPMVQVDLRSVSFVDAAGKALLAEMAREGARLIAHDCEMKQLVAELETTKVQP
jgi:hypothetical protein